MPEYNNAPTGQRVEFDPTRSQADVLALCGCDPAHYLEFTFFDARVTRVTYQDGTMASGGDPIIGQEIALQGFFPDVSPSAICAQLYAGEVSVGIQVRGKARTAIQSDLRLSIRPLGFGDETAAAHFETAVRADSLAEPGTSRFLQELAGNRDLQLYFHLNHYTRLDNGTEPEAARLTGDVYGYLWPAATGMADDPRLSHRRLVAHPRLGETPEVEQLFLLEDGRDDQGVPLPITRNTDIDGTYDILPDERLLVLRCLDFVPFLDRAYQTPEVDRYEVYFERDAGDLYVGAFSGTRGEMQETGGLLVFPLPSGVSGDILAPLAVAVVKQGAFRQPLMLETEWDLVLESDRGVTLSSGGKTSVTARVYLRNRPVAGHKVRLRTQSRNRRSPVVARLSAAEAVTSADGRITTELTAVDLRNTGGVPDPVTGQTLNELPWDRYYGNYLYLEIDNPLRRTNPPVEQVEIAARVLHAIPASPVTAVPAFDTDIRALFAYHARYFPWLHVVEQDGKYARFLDLENYDSFRGLAEEVVRRLSLPPEDPMKMPRSRDFPPGGVELIRRWIAGGMPRSAISHPDPADPNPPGGNTVKTSFAKDIKPLFRAKDINHMKTFVNPPVPLDDYDYMKQPAHAQKVYERVTSTDDHKRMPRPPDQPWTNAQQDLFKRWMDEGYNP